MTSIHPQARAEMITPVVANAHDWTIPEVGAPLVRDEALTRFDKIFASNLLVSGKGDDDLEDAYTRSVAFIENAYDVYEGKKEIEQRDWAFAVPVRGVEDQDNVYASEVTGFLPILDPRFGVNAMIRQRTTAFVPPSVIETYKGDEQGTSGALVFTPVYFDPAIRGQNGDRRAAVRALEGAQFRINDAAHFVRQRLGASVMGLGAVLPGLTRFGQKIEEEGLITTTGHGGTVHLVAETVREVSEKLNKVSRVGILGLGAIGKSSFEVLNSGEYDIPRDFIAYDTDDRQVQRVLKDNPDADLAVVSSARDVLEASDIVVVAITTPVDLDKLEREGGRPVDLAGKVIIDDSQPGAFDREQVEARGGKLVWVVGEDTAPGTPFQRMNGYQYGDFAGLHGEHAVWGCEGEAGSIALAARRGLNPEDYAVNTAVTSEIAHRVGKLCLDTGIRVSGPLQSFSRPVNLSKFNRK